MQGLLGRQPRAGRFEKTEGEDSVQTLVIQATHRYNGRETSGRSCAALALNHPRRLQVCQAEALFELFSPADGGL